MKNKGDKKEKGMLIKLLIKKYLGDLKWGFFKKNKKWSL